jgi:hypothetical protein
LSTLFLGAEDELSFGLAIRLAQHCFGAKVTTTRLATSGGKGAVKKNLHKFAKLAAREAVLLLVDLDNAQCAPSELGNWFPQGGRPSKLCLRFAVREAESWLLADKGNIADFLGVSVGKIPDNVETVSHPKQLLLRLASAGKARNKSEIVSKRNGKLRQGVGYNSALTRFVARQWDLGAAKKNAQSLSRAITALRNLS